MSETDTNRLALVESSIDLWDRARVNAFAHKFAGETNLFKSKVVTLSSIVAGLLSIIFILFAYLVNQPEIVAPVTPLSEIIKKSSDAIIVLFNYLDFEYTYDDKVFKGVVALVLTIFSIIASVVSLLFTIFGSIGRYAALANEHDLLQSFCLDVSQKIRPLKNNRPTITTEEMQISLGHLEEQFRLIKMRGSEPKDNDFVKAHKLLANRYFYRKNANKIYSFFRGLFYKEFTKRLDNLNMDASKSK